MSLPSSGQIAFSDVATEMEQLGFIGALYNYWIGSWGIGYGVYPYAEGFQFTPINVHSSNSGKYSTGAPMALSDWYGYNRNANYASDGTFRSLFLSISPGFLCFPSSMIQFDAGTSNKTFDITISGSSADFDYASAIVVWYGKPWQSNSLGTGAATKIYDYTGSFGSGLNTTINYNYTYDSGKGPYIYAVVYGNCP
jgi:hypothetical protein